MCSHSYFQLSQCDGEIGGHIVSDALRVDSQCDLGDINGVQGLLSLRGQGASSIVTQLEVEALMPAQS